jgi:hypothetical protein
MAEAVRMRQELRVKPSVESGLVCDELEENVRVVSYEPGNGTRYVLVISQMGSTSTWASGTAPHISPKALTNALGVPAGSWLVWCNNYNRALALAADSDVVHYSYVREKLGCCIIDAVVLGELIGHLLGIRHVTVDEYVQERTG